MFLERDRRAGSTRQAAIRTTSIVNIRLAVMGHYAYYLQTDRVILAGRRTFWDYQQ